MCVLALFLDEIPGHPLVVAANRDESPRRPSAPPGRLEAGIWGGKDLRAGGTWLGINRQGLFVAITNRERPARDPSMASRGSLVLEALRCSALG